MTARSDEDDRSGGCWPEPTTISPKPFSPRTGASRPGHRATHPGSRPSSRLVNGPSEIDAENRNAQAPGTAFRLGTMELALLTMLMRHVGQVVSYRDLLNEVWFRQPGHPVAETRSRPPSIACDRDWDRTVMPWYPAVRGSGYLMPVLSDDTPSTTARRRHRPSRCWAELGVVLDTSDHRHQHCLFLHRGSFAGSGLADS
ncbi:MAG: winged helix-turn-helix domain-containing protein [Tessaracoccus sp.]